ncbi:MAG TPA: MdtA/MuxA family multidrug efflux RND transporter periplasmic adaptor subunit [Burkholderiales bacterium]|jgi:multidrug efflux system membrane fusion protein|nr:MdtA/MuxA family multidrug efflux RND transporter periplasmic adaptor subunit [Burkholderiales bacterium]
MRKLKLLIAVVLLIAVAGVAYYHYERPSSAAQAPSAATGATKGGGRFGPTGPTPVVAAPATQGDIDIIVNGLGTVTPLRTVTVRSRVDGELVRVLFDEGQLVKEGDLLAEIDPRAFQVQLAQAEGQFTRDRALLENAKLDLERYRTLFKQDSIAKQQVDTQSSLVRQYEGAIAVDKSQVDNAKLQLAYSRISAPISGRIGLRQVDPGNIVRSGDTNGIVVITQLQPVTVLYTVPQDLLPQVMKRIQSGDTVGVEAWDRDQKTKLADGSLASADNQIDPQTGTVKLKAQFANDDNGLFPNQFVNVRMKLDTLHGAVLVPAPAVQRGAQGMFVYVVQQNNTVMPRNVKLGPLDGNRQAIADGLAAGEMVVTDGTDRLRPGAQVEVASARPEIKAPPPGAYKGGGRKKGGG